MLFDEIYLIPSRRLRVKKRLYWKKGGPRYVFIRDGKRLRVGPITAATLIELRHGTLRSFEEIVEAAYFGDPDGGPLWAYESVKQSVFKIKGRLAKLGLKIEGIFGRGYRLTTLNRSEVKNGYPIRRPQRDLPANRDLQPAL